MTTETKIITETVLAPTIDSILGDAYDSDPFPNLRNHLEDGYIIKQLTISTFDLKVVNEEGTVIYYPQLNCVAILERTTED